MYMVCKGAINDKNEAKAFVWHLISSINGNAVAQHNLGLYFQYGKETDNVIKEAEASHNKHVNHNKHDNPFPTRQRNFC
ncbi:hypothetical protein RclHR1_14670003 [Rhizophagus clarus]|uniref:Uncharacterized protein n=1 Tax=Rhizophagus clarus TaxID=94130 RepID=A0A2Z6R5Y1_9GLOM|nr:hypothetical protein RclHR1_14670003 [Rhizophagus clarus]